MNTAVELGVSNALVATLLAIAAFAVTRVVRRPAFVFAVWLLVLAKLIVPPIVGVPLATLRTAPAIAPAVPDVQRSLPVEFIASDLPDITALGLIVESIEPAPRQEIVEVAEAWDDSALAGVEPERFRWLAGAGLGIWLGGAAVWFAVAALRIARFRRVLRHAEPASAELMNEAVHLAARVGLRKVPEVRLVRRPGPPLVWAMAGRAIILLPAALLPRLSAAERQALVAHELVHLARRDHLVRLAELAALGLYWWHPVAWWARRNVERAAEQCCDAEVVAILGSARVYAEALLATVDFLADSRPGLPLGASGFSQARHLRRRMEMILEPTNRHPAAWPLRVALLTIGLSLLPLSVRALWAEPAAATPEESTSVDPPIGPAVEKEEVLLTVETNTETTPQPAPKATTIEERLDRLEKMIQALADHRPFTVVTPAVVPSPGVTPPAAPVITRPAAPGKPAKLAKVTGVAPKASLASKAKVAQAPATTPVPVVVTAPAAIPTPGTVPGVTLPPGVIAAPATVSPPAVYAPAAEAKDALPGSLLPAVPTRPKTPTQPAVPKRYDNSAIDEAVDEEVGEKPAAHRVDVEKQLAEFRHNAERNVQLAETNYQRRQAAERQFEAVREAYDAETVTLDQLLDAQRRLADARMSYARTVGDLATIPALREYVVATASLQASNNALNDARRIWKKVHAAYSQGEPEGADEAHAREQYFQFKTQSQQLLPGYLKAKAVYEGRKAADPFAN